jgi:crotonobetainyl-CoA:carnitine CoA-transferase CaiB-like acyl-CoA transferase
MLHELRVLDLTDDRGEFGPWLLGWFGAEVIRVEPPGGSPARLAHPLVFDGGGGARSLQFEAFNSGKRSIEANLATAAGRSALLELVTGADVVFESGPPGSLAEAGIGRPELLAANDRLVHVLVTPFGADGPRAVQPWSELTLAALGGPMSLQGVRERAPLRVSVPQVWRHTGTEAAVAALVALRRMEATGAPQWVDVSAQAAMTWTMLNSMEAHQVQGFDFERAGMTLSLAKPIVLRHQARDGYSCQSPIGVTCGPIVPWLIAEGIAPQRWAEQNWATYDHRALSGEPVDPTYAELTSAVDELCSRYTRHELLVKGLEYGSTFAPVNSVADLLALDHLEHRSYWLHDHDHDHTHDGKASIRRPGSPVTIDGGRPARPGPAPALGEAGSNSAAGLPRRRGRRNPSARPLADLPLAGVKVADFSWIGVGPITGRVLADHGATVVRVESEKRLDTTRVQPPFKDAEFGLNRSNFYGSFNTSKLSISLDLTTKEGLSIAGRLTDWADVVIDSFRPGTMERIGLGPEAVQATNPAAITVTTSLVGGGGPLSPLAGYGFHAGAIAGFSDLVGWPDLGPDGPWMAYTDTIGPRFLATAILAALDRRDRTGQGCHLEGAQLEMALHYLAPELLHYQETGTLPQRQGNRDQHLAPQGAYPCAGGDEWCAITISDDAAWARFVDVLGSPPWAADTAYATVGGCLGGPNHRPLDEPAGGGGGGAPGHGGRRTGRQGPTQP